LLLPYRADVAAVAAVAAATAAVAYRPTNNCKLCSSNCIVCPRLSLAKNETTATAMASKSVEQQQQQQQLQWQKATGNKLPGNTHAPPKVMFVPQRRHLSHTYCRWQHCKCNTATAAATARAAAATQSNLWSHCTKINAKIMLMWCRDHAIYGQFQIIHLSNIFKAYEVFIDIAKINMQHEAKVQRETTLL